MSSHWARPDRRVARESRQPTNSESPAPISGEKGTVRRTINRGENPVASATHAGEDGSGRVMRSAGNRCVVLSVSGRNRRFFERGLLVALSSLRRTNPDLEIAVLCDRLDEDQRSALAGCRLVGVDARRFQTSHRPDLTAATYFRFVIPEALSTTERAVYLDSDLVVLDRLDDLFELDSPLAAVPKSTQDPAGEFQDPDRLAAAEGFDSWGPLLSAGVLSMDLEFWRREGLLELFSGLIARHGWETFRNGDQGALNVLVQRYGFHELSPVYNLWPQAWAGSKLGRNHLGIRAPEIAGTLATIVHWAGPRKPWLASPLDRLLPHRRRRTLWTCYAQFARRSRARGR